MRSILFLALFGFVAIAMVQARPQSASDDLVVPEGEEKSAIEPIPVVVEEPVQNPESEDEDEVSQPEDEKDEVEEPAPNSESEEDDEEPKPEDEEDEAEDEEEEAEPEDDEESVEPQPPVEQKKPWGIKDAIKNKLDEANKKIEAIRQSIHDKVKLLRA